MTPVAYHLNGWPHERFQIVRMDRFKLDGWGIETGTGSYLEKEHGFMRSSPIDEDCVFASPEEAYAYFKAWLTNTPTRMVYVTYFRKKSAELWPDEKENP